VNRGLMGGSQAFGDVKGEKIEVLLDGERLGLFEWERATATPRGGSQPGTIDVRFSTKAGRHAVGVAFLATEYAPLLDLNNPFERTTIETGGLPGFTFYPHVGSVRIDGPFSATGAIDSASRRRIFVCRPAAGSSTGQTEDRCAEKIVSTLAARAFRQPVASDDFRDLMTLYRNGRRDAGFDKGIEMALQGILVHTKFIYRHEAEPANVAAGQAYRISDPELASRLSFFLWSTGPDDQLVGLANQNKLHEPVELERQVRRMLKDRRSDALVTNFAGQWLKLRNLEAAYPAVPLFPDFDDNLRQAFRREVELFFGSIVQEDRNVVDLLNADYTFVNERLARHYGIPNVYGSQFRRITLGPEFDVRRGLLGKGAIQTVSALPTRTSLVGRGKWILQNIVGTQPPDPPPFAVPPLESTGKNGAVLTLRQQMEMHRAQEPCNSCHKIMDPIGLSMENFDAIGRWRTEDEGSPIDASGVLVDGTRMNGVVDLREALLRYSPQFVRNLTERLFTYALGRGVEYYDMPAVRTIVHDAESHGNHFSSLIEGIVKSKQFQSNMKVNSTD